MRTLTPFLLLITAIIALLLSTKTSRPENSISKAEKPALNVPKKLQSKRYATDATVLDNFKGNQQRNSFPGFTLYPEVGTETIHLVNMDGVSVHTWRIDAARALLLQDCSLLVVHGSKWGLKNEPWRSLRSTIRSYDWDGKTLWEHKGSDNPFHHDVTPLTNGNFLSIESVQVAVQTDAVPRFKPAAAVTFLSDSLVEFSKTGEEVWRWDFHSHLDLDSCGKYRCPEPRKTELEGEKAFDWSHVNSAKELPANRWFDQGDTRFRPGNVLILARNWSTVLLIDKDSKKIVWTYEGDPDSGLQYGHEAVMIAPELPGAGNILLFDNGVGRRQSQVLEIEPPTRKIVWSYAAGARFFSAAAGAAQRLPNGNTLISEDLAGRTLEVDSNGEIVWAYEGQRIRSARARRYAPDFCRTLSTLPLYTE